MGKIKHSELAIREPVMVRSDDDCYVYFKPGWSRSSLVMSFREAENDHRVPGSACMHTGQSCACQFDRISESLWVEADHCYLCNLLWSGLT